MRGQHPNSCASQNTLNKCFDDIERFAARIQSVAVAKQELELYSSRFRTNQRRSRARDAALAAQHGILQLRAQLPSYQEFYDVFQKFKLSFNLLVRLDNPLLTPPRPNSKTTSTTRARKS